MKVRFEPLVIGVFLLIGVSSVTPERGLEVFRCHKEILTYCFGFGHVGKCFLFFKRMTEPATYKQLRSRKHEQ